MISAKLLAPTPTAPLPSLRYGATVEFMNGLGYTTIIEFAEPLAGPSPRSRAKTDRCGPLGR